MTLLFLEAQIITRTFFFLSGFIIFTGAAIMIPQAGMQALQVAQDKASGTSLMNSINLLLCALLVTMTGHMIGHHSIVLPVVIIIITVLSLFALISYLLLKINNAA